MSHSPPVPPGNQSPFPLQEPPHQATPNAAKPKADGAAPASARQGLLALAAGAAGVGVVAGIAAALFLRSSPRTKPKAKRKPAGKRAKAS